MPPLLDIVYPVRAGDDNDELRYSLRTIEANFPHGEVWIVGHRPPWLTGVQHIPGNGQQHRHANVYHNVLTACAHPDIPERFAIFNDDFYITEHVAEIPTLYRGTLAAHLELQERLRINFGQWWPRSLFATMIALQTAGHREPLSYELHAPFVVDKAAMAETLQRFAGVQPENPPQWRSLYGNMHNIGGEIGEDPKMTRPGPVKTPFHSTDDGSWRRYFQSYYRERFPEPSRYEKA